MKSQTKTIDINVEKISDIAMAFKLGFLSCLVDFAKIAMNKLDKEDLMDVFRAASGYISAYGAAAEIGYLNKCIEASKETVEELKKENALSFDEPGISL